MYPGTNFFSLNLDLTSGSSKSLCEFCKVVATFSACISCSSFLDTSVLT